MSIQQMNFGDNSELRFPKETRGWVHATINPGVYGSTCTSFYYLEDKPTMPQFRKEGYQSIGALPRFDTDIVARKRGVFSILPEDIFGKKEDAIKYVDIPVKSNLQCFNMAQVRDMERRWVSVGRTQGYFDNFSDDAFVTIIANITGRVDSLLITPNRLLTYYEIQIQGTPVFQQMLLQMSERHELPFVLLMFENRDLSYAEVSAFGKDPSSWLQTTSACPVVFR